MLLHVSPGNARGVLLSLDSEKKIRVEKRWDEFSESIFLNFLRLPGSVRKSVVSVDPSLIFVASTLIEFSCDTADRPLEPVELENLLAQSVGRIFNQCRRKASGELGVDELDTILADSRISGFKADGHHVINPLGFKARKIEASLELIFTPREIFNTVKNFIRGRDDFFFTGVLRAELASFARVSGRNFNLLATQGLDSYILSFRTEQGRRKTSRKKLSWSADAFPKAISKEWSLGAAAGETVYEAYLKKEISPAMDKFLRRILNIAADSLLRELEKGGLAGTVYLDAENLPFELLAGRRKSFKKLPLEEFFDKSGFVLGGRERPLLGQDVFRELAPFFEFYYDNKESDVNHWLRRRLHWLGSAK